jgi:GNAT superfamily N-acetyltransferase
MISIQLEPSVSLQEYSGILISSGLAKRRPMDSPVLLQRMISGSNMLVTARLDTQLVGFLRGLSDFCYRSFVADLAVAKEFQGQGIGRQLLQFTRELAPEARIFLFSAEDAEGFYLKMGFHLHDRCYQLKPDEAIH